MKVICQNCFRILADKEEGYVKCDINEVDVKTTKIDDDTSLLTITCPDCDCSVQVKV